MFNGLIEHLDKIFYQHVTVIKGLGYDQNQMVDVVESVEGKKCL